MLLRIGIHHPWCRVCSRVTGFLLVLAATSPILHLYGGFQTVAMNSQTSPKYIPKLLWECHSWFILGNWVWSWQQSLPSLKAASLDWILQSHRVSAGVWGGWSFPSTCLALDFSPSMAKQQKLTGEEVSKNRTWIGYFLIASFFLNIFWFTYNNAHFNIQISEHRGCLETCVQYYTQIHS